MPRIPTVPGGRSESTSTGSLSPGQVALPFRQLAENLDRFAVIKDRIDAEDQRQRDSVVMSQSLLAAEEALSGFYQAAVESEDFEASGEIFRTAAEVAGLGFADGISNEEDQARFALQYARRAGSLEIQIENRTRRLRTAAHQDTLTDLGDQTARSASQLPVDDDAGREALFQTFAEEIARAEASGVITDGAKRMEDMRETADKDTVNNMARQNPHELKRLLDQRDESGKLVNFLHLDVPDRNSAQNAAISGIKQQLIVDDAAEEDRKFAAERFAIERNVGIIPGGTLTELETAELGLGITRTRALNQMAEDIANKKNLDRDNFAVKNEVGIGVRSGRITSPLDVLSRVGLGGISFDTAENLIGIQEAIKNSPEKKAQYTRMMKVIEGFKAPITRNQVTGDVDEPGQSNFNAFMFETERRFFEGIEKGLATDELLDPTSPNYIVDPKAYLRDLDTSLQDSLITFGFVPEEPELDENEEVVTKEGQRLPNESTEDFLKRTAP